MDKARAAAVLQTIFERRSTRGFKEGRPLSGAAIALLLEAGMAGPSACNLQPWEYVVVTEADTLRKIEELAPYGKYGAPMALVVCGNTAHIPWQDPDWKIDCGAAVENMMLLATALGLGSVWIGEYDEAALRELLNIPPNIQVMNLVYFGHPRQKSRPKTRFNPEAVFYGRYDPKRKRTMRATDTPDNARPWTPSALDEALSQIETTEET